MTTPCFTNVWILSLEHIMNDMIFSQNRSIYCTSCVCKYIKSRQLITFEKGIKKLIFLGTSLILTVLQKKYWSLLFLPKASITLSRLRLLVYFLSILRIASELSLSWHIVLLKYVFILLRALNDLSEEHEVAGIVANIIANLEKR